ncbi:hypothetical protein [Phytohabitans houttuyneae]|uniref:Uncharacterized protein n=1 Tax=Phytohabitans houttuyneae TaxID=1076126 RepID=A0A6V8KLK7_9ACTN|nr:hypothetical protein [Phytohabitans houttuyneae]GFJ83398.1 hypothetical protein Phou_075780 [Phytohabitans houttuyneae]
MAGGKQRRPVPDRARRRAIRALAARLGVAYSVAARLLDAQDAPAVRPLSIDEHWRSVFALREHRTFHSRVSDTRLATDLPLGRATHLTERFPPWRAQRMYDGAGRQTTLAMLYAVVAHESPALVPSADELAWVAELGEETAVDITCDALDRAARLLLDDDRWRLWTRVDAALAAGQSNADWRVRDAARTLGRELRSVSLRGSLDGVRHILDALLVAAYEGHPPGTRVRVLSGPSRDLTGTVVGVRWPAAGPLMGYQVRLDADLTVHAFAVDDVAPLDQPAAPQPATT